MDHSKPDAAKRERFVLCFFILGLLAVLLAGLKPMNRDLTYQPLLLALLVASHLYQLVLRPKAAIFTISVLVLVPGLFVFLHYYSAVALVPALVLVAKFALAACLYRALYILLAAALPPRSARHLRHLQMLTALALPPLTAYLLIDASILFLTALTLASAVLAVYLMRVRNHD